MITSQKNNNEIKENFIFLSGNKMVYFLNSMDEANMKTNEILNYISGSWKISNYIGSGNVKDENGIFLPNNNINKKLVGQNILFSKEMIESISPVVETGYIYRYISEAFFGYTFPPIEINAPFACINIKHKKFKNKLMLIIDKSGNFYLVNNLDFFKLTKNSQVVK